MSVVWLFHPSDVRAMYKAEGSHPSRRSHTALAHLRASKPKSYNTGGLLPTNGAEWQRIINITIMIMIINITTITPIIRWSASNKWIRVAEDQGAVAKTSAWNSCRLPVLARS